MSDLPAMMVPWQPPKPSRLLTWRQRILDYTRSDVAMFELARAVNDGRATIFPTAPMTGSIGAIAAPLLIDLECQRLADAAVYYASADMTSLALAVASTPPLEPASAARLPSLSGFMVFAEPIGGYLVVGPQPDISPPVSIPIVAVSWSRWRPCDVHVKDGPPGARVSWHNKTAEGDVRPITEDFDGVWITFYTPTVATRYEMMHPDTVVGVTPTRPLTAGLLARIRLRTPLDWDNESAIAFGTHFGPPRPDTTDQWVQVVYAAWQLMTQTDTGSPLVDITEIPERSTRKRRHLDRRAGVTGPPRVRIVRVHPRRRPSRQDTAADAAASSGRHAPQWTCRWKVRPYRRWTCMNPRAHADGGCEHVEKIVLDHDKGPQHLPLRPSRTVKLWDRQPEDPSPDPPAR